MTQAVQVTTDTVYVARRNRDGLYKIGYTTVDPAKRRQSLGRKADGISLIHCFRSADPFTVEQYLHVAFYPERVSGEWFRLTPEMVRALSDITRCDSTEELPCWVHDRRDLHAGRPDLGWGSSLPRERRWAKIKIDDQVLPLVRAAAALLGMSEADYISDLVNLEASRVLGMDPIKRRPPPPKPHGYGRPKPAR